MTGVLPPTISTLGVGIKSLFTHLVEACEDREDWNGIFHDQKQLVETVEDELGRFRVWGANLGAFHESNSTASLDYRLKNGPKMRKSVITGLERLNDVAHRGICVFKIKPDVASHLTVCLQSMTFLLEDVPTHRNQLLMT